MLRGELDRSKEATVEVWMEECGFIVEGGLMVSSRGRVVDVDACRIGLILSVRCCMVLWGALHCHNAQFGGYHTLAVFNNPDGDFRHLEPALQLSNIFTVKGLLYMCRSILLLCDTPLQVFSLAYPLIPPSTSSTRPLRSRGLGGRRTERRLRTLLTWNTRRRC